MSEGSFTESVVEDAALAGWRAWATRSCTGRTSRRANRRRARTTTDKSSWNAAYAMRSCG